MSMRLAFVSCVVCATGLAAPKKAIGDARDELAPLPASPAATPDGVLLRALGYAFEPSPPEVRAQAIEDLGLLGDPRALDPLAQLCLDPNPLFARAAVRAVAAFRGPRAEAILADLVRQPSVPEATRLRALELLPFQNSWSSIRVVIELAREERLTNLVLAARRLALELPRPPPRTSGGIPFPGRDTDAGTPSPTSLGT